MCENVEKFASVHSHTSEQHVELRSSRISADVRDVQKIMMWFQTHSPFPETKEIVCIANGTVGENAVNCHNAFQVGSQILSEIFGGNFKDLKLKRSKRVISLASTSSSIKVHDDLIPVDTNLLFQRIICFTKDEDELKSCFSYELAPFPPSLFHGSQMRKTQKSTLYSVFTPCAHVENDEHMYYIIDGGFLLHRVHWSEGCTYNEILDAYVTYVLRHFQETTVVFDGYNGEDTTKDAEQKRRYGEKVQQREIFFNLSMKVTSTREKFLANKNNKTRLIEALKIRFVSRGISVRQAEGDADLLIVQTAIDTASTKQTKKVYIVGEDVDLLVLLIYHSSLRDDVNNVKLLKPGKTTQKGKTKDSVYCPQSIRSDFPNIENYILFLHAFSG